MECMFVQTRPRFILSSKSFLGNGVRTHAKSKGKMSSTGGSEEGRTRDTAPRKTGSPTHYPLSYSDPRKGVQCPDLLLSRWTPYHLAIQQRHTQNHTQSGGNPTTWPSSRGTPRTPHSQVDTLPPGHPAEAHPEPHTVRWKPYHLAIQQRHTQNPTQSGGHLTTWPSSRGTPRTPHSQRHSGLGFQNGKVSWKAGALGSRGEAF